MTTRGARPFLAGCLALIVLAGCASTPGTAVPGAPGPSATAPSASPTTGPNPSTGPTPPSSAPESAPESASESPGSNPGPTVEPVPDSETTAAWAAPPATGSAAEALAPFFTAVTDIDARLQTAAAAVNAGIGDEQVTVDQATVDLVDAAAPWPAAEAVPAGLDPATEQAVLLVYSDLVSRWGALRGGDCLQVGTVPRNSLNADCFVRGHEAKVRMPGDVEAARAAAASSVIGTPDPGSPEAAEVLLRIEYINKANLGCGTMGGYIATDPVLVEWAGEPSGDPTLPPTDGKVNGVRFRAAFDETAGWSIELLAC